MARARELDALRADVSGGVHTEALRRAAEASRWLMLMGPPSAIVLALLITEPTAARRWWFVGMTVATTSFAMLALSAVLTKLRRGRGDEKLAVRVSILALASASIGWPSAILVLSPRSIAGTYLILFFCVAAVASSLTASAAHEPYFLALVFTELIPITLFIGTGYLAPDVPEALAVMAVLFMGMLYATFRTINRTIREAVEGRLVEEGLTAQLSEANARLVHRATHDDLTGLANRALFREVLERHLATPVVRGEHIAVFYLDIDRFKVVNDSLGHVEGDQLLRESAERLRHGVRNNDLLARLGGDEFTVVAPGLDVGEALRLGERIRSCFDEPFTVGGLHTVTSVSVGVALSRPGVTSIDLMRYADAALYEAKNAGRNRVVLFDEAMRSTLSTRLERENALRHALASNQFEAWYQPIVDPITRRIIAVEALARWHHPRHGILDPGLFLPLMTECGLTRDLDAEIGRQARATRRSLIGIAPDGFRIFMNVSAGTSQLDEIIESHRAAAELDHTPLSGIGIEITEQAIVSHPETASVALALARDRGLAVMLDDVGTGYSSLSLIRALPLDGLKVDSSFIQGMERDAADAAVVASIAALGRRLGLSVTAEGVETEGQLQALNAEGITHAQGFLFSPAVPESELAAWFVSDPPWLRPRPVARLRNRR